MTGFSKKEQARKPKRTKPKPEYGEATERARNNQGYIVCECEGCMYCADRPMKRCRRSLLDHQAFRHHILFRSRGGTDAAENLLTVCSGCHAAAHGIYHT